MYLKNEKVYTADSSSSKKIGWDSNTKAQFFRIVQHMLQFQGFLV